MISVPIQEIQDVNEYNAGSKWSRNCNLGISLSGFEMATIPTTIVVYLVSAIVCIQIVVRIFNLHPADHYD